MAASFVVFACGDTASTRGTVSPDIGVDSGTDADSTDVGPDMDTGVDVDVGPSAITTTALTAGPGRMCAVRSQQLWCSGTGLRAISDDAPWFSATPVVVRDGVQNVDAHAGSICLARVDGGVECVGGRGSYLASNADRTPMTELRSVSGTRDIVRVQASRWHACGIDVNSALWCRVFNGDLRVDLDGAEGDVLPPRRLASGVLDFAVSATHTCWIDRDGTVVCAGSSIGSSLGASGESPSFNQLDALAVSIDAGGYTTCAGTEEGDAQCWGVLGVGQLADGVAGRDFTRTARFESSVPIVDV